MTSEERKEYNRKWYLANRESELAKSKEYAQANRDILRRVSRNLAARNRQYINNLKSNPCMDCKQSFPPCAMEFDHKDRSTKYAEIGNLASSHWSLKKIQTEIDKCDLVCSNCHRIRTYNKKHYLPLERLTKGSHNGNEIQSALSI